MLAFEIGIMAYNEEQNIGKLLSAIEKETFSETSLREIWVVASGCTDRTVEVVKEFSVRDPRVKLLVQEKREGKSSAVNLWLKNVTADVLILVSADTLPANGSLEKLLWPFRDATIGMTGARPVPINDPNSFLGYAAHLMWDLHHRISLENPKMGEMVAFRNIIREIPADSAVDEASLEAAITSRGYKIQYVPEAIVRNKGPETLGDFVRQRRRIYAGHLSLRQKNYIVSTLSVSRILKLLFSSGNFSWRTVIYAPFVALLEAWSRLLGWYDSRVRKTEPRIWKVAKTTKNLNLR